MKASELVKTLQEMIGRVGDVEVFAWPYGGQVEYYDVEGVEIEFPGAKVGYGAPALMIVAKEISVLRTTTQ